MPISTGMCTKLPVNALEERLRWVRPITNGEIKLKDAAKVFPGGKRTLERWVARYKLGGIEALVPQSTRPKSQPAELPIRVKERIIELRQETKLCSKKLNYKLAKEGIKVSDRVIGKIIKAEGLVRQYHIRKLKYSYVKVPLTAGELVEIDIKFVPAKIKGQRYYQFTAIDCATRWRYLKIYSDCGNGSAIAFSKQLLKVAPFRIRAIKTDNGACFTNRYTGYQKSADPINPRLHPFDLFWAKRNIIHYLIDPGKPAQNGKVERSHRTDQEMFYDRHQFKTALELRKAVRTWNMAYNNLEHIALAGLTPVEAVRNYS